SLRKAPPSICLIRMQIRQIEGGAFLSEARAPTKNFDALITGVAGDVSLSYLAAMFESSQRGGSLDYAAFHSPDLDAAFAAARAAATDAAKRQAWFSVQRLLTDSMPIAWVYHS